MIELEQNTKKLKRQIIALVILALVCLAAIVALAIIFIADPLPRVAVILTAIVGLWSMAFFGMKAAGLLMASKANDIANWYIMKWKEQDNEYKRHAEQHN
jgi:uncharacterized membrane protein